MARFLEISYKGGEKRPLEFQHLNQGAHISQN